MKENKEKKEMYCSYEYFMKHRCNGCKLGRECEEWDRNSIKRDSDSNDDTVTINSNKQKG